MRVTNKLKHGMLRYYLWIAAAMFTASLVSLTTFARNSEIPTKLTLLGVPFSFLFLVQKQKLEETRLFKELFQEFNARYDRLNAELNRIRNDSSAIMPSNDRDILYDYFNLCGEEHFFYRLGFIPEEVWASWQTGMTTFLDCDRIRREWNEDPASGSYYGLTFPATAQPSLREDFSNRAAA